MVPVNIMQCEYWANITNANNWTSYFIMCGIGGIIYTILFLTYFYIRVLYLELFAPLPLVKVKVELLP